MEERNLNLSDLNRPAMYRNSGKSQWYEKTTLAAQVGYTIVYATEGYEHKPLLPNEEYIFAKGETLGELIERTHPSSVTLIVEGCELDGREHYYRQCILIPEFESLEELKYELHKEWAEDPATKEWLANAPIIPEGA